ncbi:MAG: hypothetical protein Q8Q31_05220 [Nanoarchaeota archaeon]|nr:hypothetical protein [Nanoarchaeota archaeon]
MAEVYIHFPKSREAEMSAILYNAECMTALRNSFIEHVNLVGDLKPVFPSPSQVDYLKSIGANPENTGVYRVYLHDGVTELVERCGGLEAPLRTLESPEVFRREIISRIRNQFGAWDMN